jgi:hypothetical protein
LYHEKTVGGPPKEHKVTDSPKKGGNQLYTETREKNSVVRGLYGVTKKGVEKRGSDGVQRCIVDSGEK